MKAVLCKQFGGPSTLSVEDVPSPVAAKGQVVVGVHASAVNFPDTLIIENRYQFKPPLPFSPGGEFAGTVLSVGEGVADYATGDRVIAFAPWGAFAEEIAVDAKTLIRLPAQVRMEQGAALMMAYGTTYYALKDRARLQAGETLLVLGAAGGTGIAAIELGKLMGARVIAMASTDEKLALCKKRGAHETINYTSENFRERVKQLTDGRGVDVVYDPVGGTLTDLAVRGMAWNGRLLVIGFTSGEIPKLPLNLVLLKGCSVVGVFYGAFSEREPQRCSALTDELLALVAQGRLDPAVTERYRLEQASQALQKLADRQAMGKIVLLTERERQA